MTVATPQNKYKFQNLVNDREALFVYVKTTRFAICCFKD